jgi:hypothetical protein
LNFCGRYVNSHAATHSADSGHLIGLSFSDLSVWCYGCDSYIKHPVKYTNLFHLLKKVQSLSGILNKVHSAKFATPPPSASPAVTTTPKADSSSSDEEGTHKIALHTPKFSFQDLTEMMKMMMFNKTPKTPLECPALSGDITLDGIVNAIKNGKCTINLNTDISYSIFR